MFKTRIIAIIILLVGIGIGWFFIAPQSNLDLDFKLGLDLAGGAHLVYKADISKIDPSTIDDSMNSLRDVIEKRTNLFGVSEPKVQVEKNNTLSKNPEYRLIVELPGVADLTQAIQIIGKTPFLEFKTINEKALESQGTSTEIVLDNLDEIFVSTDLTGQYLKKAQLVFDQMTGKAGVAIEFDSKGKEIFARLTEENVGKVLAIFLDNQVISNPVVNGPIRDGKAEITGTFTPEEARELVRNLNYGALPVPISLLSTQSIGASLGTEVLEKGIYSGLIGLILVIIFLIIYYRIPGIIASVSLILYIILMLVIFKLFSITLTAAGIAGFILSIGMAVDANILIFERMKEELKEGRDKISAVREGFARAWLSIRDSNISSLITAIILFWFGTSLIEGFALTFGLGVLISMLTAITISRTFLLAILGTVSTK